MTVDRQPSPHHSQHLAAARRGGVQPPAADLIRVGSRRWFLQTGLAGVAGLSLPELLRCRAEGAAGTSRNAVILIWLSGGPSQLDTWDPKPDAPAKVRGPWRSIATRVPGVHVSEHLPLQADILGRLAVVGRPLLPAGGRRGFGREGSLAKLPPPFGQTTAAPNRLPDQNLCGAIRSHRAVWPNGARAGQTPPPPARHG